MILKVVCLAMTLAVVSARPQGHDQGHASLSSKNEVHQKIQLQHHKAHHKHDTDYYAHPKYEYAYEVVDQQTHDHKFQHEAREGDAVKGIYSVQQPDGTLRIVEYYADKKIGFNANVKYEGHAAHVVPEHQH
ncbi:larval cuticle protein A2B-like [Anticarsia gemmatalis]|uniref:larval cuticle protein A2B-like n=1 Tax=Anticarsia gemmatalis TaxID=129554 RepID=UPI003F776E3A